MRQPLGSEKSLLSQRIRRRRSRTYAAAAALAASLAAVALMGCGGSDATQQKLHGFVRTPPLRVGDVALPDVAPGGRTRSPMRAAPDGLLLVFFGYTFCPDVCPTTLADLRTALGQLPRDERRQIEVALVTVDPARDTPKALNRYLGHFFGSWRALRATDPAQLRRAERAFNATHRLGPKDQDGNYEVAHTAMTYVVDRAGLVRIEWSFGMSSADMAADLRSVLASTDT